MFILTFIFMQNHTLKYIASEIWVSACSSDCEDLTLFWEVDIC
jgi:hypothetical protein